MKNRCAVVAGELEYLVVTLSAVAGTVFLANQVRHRFRTSQFAREANRFDRGALGREFRAGPLIVESYDTTVVVPPGTRARADATGNLILEID